MIFFLLCIPELGFLQLTLMFPGQPIEEVCLQGPSPLHLLIHFRFQNPNCGRTGRNTVITHGELLQLRVRAYRLGTQFQASLGKGPQVDGGVKRLNLGLDPGGPLPV